jgi:hypothetical protein
LYLSAGKQVKYQGFEKKHLQVLISKVPENKRKCRSVATSQRGEQAYPGPKETGLRAKKS